MDGGKMLVIVLAGVLLCLAVEAVFDGLKVDATPEPAPETDAQELIEAVHARIDAELAMIEQALRDAGIETYDLILARRLRAGVE